MNNIIDNNNPFILYNNIEFLNNVKRLNNKMCYYADFPESLEWWLNKIGKLPITYADLYYKTNETLEWYREYALRTEQSIDPINEIVIIKKRIEKLNKAYGIDNIQHEFDLTKRVSFANDIKIINNMSKIYSNQYSTLINACLCGDVDTLNKFKDEVIMVHYSEEFMDSASLSGNINVLNWLAESGLELKYSEKSMDYASLNNHINVLDWWIAFTKEKGLPLKYSDRAMTYASQFGNIKVLDWWLESELPLEYTEEAMDNASLYNRDNVLEWWLQSNKTHGIELKYSKNALQFANKYNSAKSIEWWNKSGLDLKRSEPIIKQKRKTTFIRGPDGKYIFNKSKFRR